MGEPTTSNGGIVRQSGEPLTDIEKHLNIRKQIEQRRKNLFPVQPKPPQGFKDYLMNKKTYHLEGNTGKDSRIQPIPKIAPPPSLEGPLRELFLSQENERYKLRMKHLVEQPVLLPTSPYLTVSVQYCGMRRCTRPLILTRRKRTEISEVDIMGGYFCPGFRTWMTNGRKSRTKWF